MVVRDSRSQPANECAWKRGATNLPSQELNDDCVELCDAMAVTVLAVDDKNDSLDYLYPILCRLHDSHAHKQSIGRLADWCGARRIHTYVQASSSIIIILAHRSPSSAPAAISKQHSEQQQLA